MTTSLRLWPPICACHQRCTALSPACEHGAATLARLAGHERAVSQHPVFAGFPRRRLAVHRRLEGWAGRQSPGNAVLHRRGGRLPAHAVAGAPRPLPSKCSRPPTHGPQPGESFRRCVAESTAASLWIVCQLDGPLTHGPQPCRLARWRWCLRPCSPPTTSSFSALTNSWWAASPRCFLTMSTSTSRCAPDRACRMSRAWLLFLVNSGRRGQFIVCRCYQQLTLFAGLSASGYCLGDGPQGVQDSGVWRLSPLYLRSRGRTYRFWFTFASHLRQLANDSPMVRLSRFVCSGRNWAGSIFMMLTPILDHPCWAVGEELDRPSLSRCSLRAHPVDSGKSSGQWPEVRRVAARGS